MEKKLGNNDRIRKLFEEFLWSSPSKTETWIGCATFEREVGESERARSHYDLALKLNALDQPEMLYEVF